MRTERYDPEALITLLRQRKIATMEDLKEALGTSYFDLKNDALA